ncbi:MAG: heavy metal translocating P-type ATPase [Fusobacterium mortiferum]|jgi:cation-transporting P-type ATPase C|uniref:Heavy metal translocating P-type ATPase n=2 Tax=Fusobacterium mortiferum TaxID=850 RepID=A0A414PZ73_FUSMR|nr:MULTISPECIES: heavy metal translocating P-type ATPase [Fusobacterium]AVQ18531.1 heavy metal translocating P-type ATPase [Fusobacterium mortiferum ATCC 9817]EEO34770.1 heavy metal translocating P-type ATPase [Fusobacterium mortiferum ATCC 9817]MCF2627366.1 heavy metal translocating P-type ATPase [Fusobacterium mortiferum]MCF2699431.1 heavy metal translocating P-type ATPase [Fusobacterium mortiferum]MCI7187671.1 heavy metal translocating P-type ATPase [Fusobacterium mortiferum]
MKGRTNGHLLYCEVVHKIRGRVRIKSKALKYLGKLKNEVEKQLEQVRYIESAKISSVTGTVVIYFDDINVTDDNLIALIQNTLNVYLVEIYKNERAENSKNIVIERKLQEESPEEIIKKMTAAGILLIYNIFKKAPAAPVVGIKRLFNPNTLAVLSLAAPVISNGLGCLVKNKRPNADTLSSSAIISSLLLGKEKTALTIMIMEEFAELLTVYTMKKTRGAIKDMLSVGENYVWKVMENGSIQKVAIEEISKGDKIVVQTGEKISVDGVITKGEAYIDQSSITGEYMPVTKKVGENVFAGTIIKNGNITIEAEKVGDERTVSRIIKLVEDANFNKAQIQNYADNFSAQLIPLNFLLAGIVYGTTRNIQKAMSMLVIDYSCGIRLSTAAAFSAAINTAAKNGILIKGSNYIEEISKADTIIFDKTGTITEGKPSVQTIKLLDKNIGENKMLAYAAAAEETSTHPLAVAILNEVKERGLEIPNHTENKVIVARGIETEVGDSIIRVGSKKFMEENGISTDNSHDEVKVILGRGEILIYVAKDDKLIGLIGVTDPPRENIKRTINRLRGQGIDEIVLLTGDLEQQAQTIASRMSIDSYESELLPEDKARNILALQSRGSNVIMIGDGINDAPALSYANIGVALGSTRTDVAMEAADITITKDDPLLVPEVIGLSKKTVKTIKENFAMAIGINSFALVLGATGILPAIYSSVIHNMSTILVVGNSLKLLKYKLKN